MPASQRPAEPKAEEKAAPRKSARKRKEQFKDEIASLKKKYRKGGHGSFDRFSDSEKIIFVTKTVEKDPSLLTSPGKDLREKAKQEVKGYYSPPTKQVIQTSANGSPLQLLSPNGTVFVRPAKAKLRKKLSLVEVGLFQTQASGEQNKNEVKVAPPEKLAKIREKIDADRPTSEIYEAEVELTPELLVEAQKQAPEYDSNIPAKDVAHAYDKEGREKKKDRRDRSHGIAKSHGQIKMKPVLQDEESRKRKYKEIVAPSATWEENSTQLALTEGSAMDAQIRKRQKLTNKVHVELKTDAKGPLPIEASKTIVIGDGQGNEVTWKLNGDSEITPAKQLRGVATFFYDDTLPLLPPAAMSQSSNSSQSSADSEAMDESSNMSQSPRQR